MERASRVRRTIAAAFLAAIVGACGFESNPLLPSRGGADQGGNSAEGMVPAPPGGSGGAAATASGGAGAGTDQTSVDAGDGPYPDAAADPRKDAGTPGVDLCDGVDCSAVGDQCNAGQCDPGSGLCVTKPRNGGPCEDGLYCTHGDVCEAGACKAGPARDCGLLEDTCNTAQCNDDTDACEKKPRKNGTACDDGKSCTMGETCLDGICGTTSCKPGSNCTADCPLSCSCDLSCQDANKCTATCAANSACSVNCFDANECNATCGLNTSPCDVDCRQGGTCRLTCQSNADCNFECDDATKCEVDCAANSSCDVDCAGAGTCNKIRCSLNAECLLRCGLAPGNCSFETCPTTVTDCGLGVFVCGRACP